METKIISPVEEHHIDYILEEEFCVDSKFLHFFLDKARLMLTTESGRRPSILPAPAQEHGCRAVRSVTTSKGESDVIVTYETSARDEVLPVAILIEDKIRAPFQKDQPSRYRERGEAGKGKEWAEYWTCLVAHRRYAIRRGDFDIVVTLQDLLEHFSLGDDARSKFRAGVLKEAISKYERSGVQIVDRELTAFRTLYAAEFDARFLSDQWWREPARPAWRDDTWFDFRKYDWPTGMRMRHQARTGRVQLILPTGDTDLFRRIVERYDVLEGIAAIEVVSVGKWKLSFALQVPKLNDFSNGTAAFIEFFSAIEYLAGFYDRCSEMLPVELRGKTRRQPVGVDLRYEALNSMLFGFLRSYAISTNSTLSLPLRRLSENLVGESMTVQFLGELHAIGGFELALHNEEDGQPYILATLQQQDSKQEKPTYKIAAREVQMLS